MDTVNAVDKTIGTWGKNGSQEKDKKGEKEGKTKRKVALHNFRNVVRLITDHQLQAKWNSRHVISQRG